MAWSDCLLKPITCVTSNAGETAANSAWESFLKWTARGMADLSATVFDAFSTSTAPRFDQQWWRDNLDMMITVSLPILVAVFVLQCLSAVIRREPSRLGHAAMGALLGTAGVPVAVGVIAICGNVVDEISVAILSTHATADGIKRMTDLTVVLGAATLGGFLLLAVLLGLLAMFALYFVMLVREVALVAFVVFAPVAMASWTWQATRHWLRRWVEVVGALLFSKIAMAVVFTVGISATGAADQGGTSTFGTFLAGILLIGLAAFTPLATLSFIQWAGDQGHAASRALQQGATGVQAARDQVERAQEWRAEHFGGSDKDEPSPVVDGDSDPPDDSSSSDVDEPGSGDQVVGQRADDQEPVDGAGPTVGTGLSSEPYQGVEQPAAEPSPESSAGGADTGSTAIAVSNSEVSVDVGEGANRQSDDSSDSPPPSERDK